MMKQRVKNWVLVVLIVLWALAFAQAPQYMELYFSHLTGHVEELHYQVQKLEKILEVDLLDLKPALEKQVKSSDSMISKQGTFLLQLVERYQTFHDSWQSLRDARPWSRPFVFMANHSFEIGREVCQFYTFGLPITWDGLIYAILGALAGWGIFHLIGYSYAKMKGLFNKKQEPPK